MPNNLSPQDVIAQARTWMKVPYKHHGREKSIAVDCAGLVIGVGRELQLMDHNDFAYGEWPKADYLLRECDKVLEQEVLAKEAGEDAVLQHVAPGKVLVMYSRSPREAQHMGIVGEHNGRLTLIHAFSKRDMVVEQGLDNFWRKRILGVYRYPKVEYPDGQS